MRSELRESFGKRRLPARLLLLPDKGSEGAKGPEPEPLIKPEGSAIEVGYGKGYLRISKPQRLAKGEIEQRGSQSQGLKLRAYRDLGYVGRGAMHAGERH